MKLDLDNKVVLVTGGSKGIGLACAELFAAEGARVAICSRAKSNIDHVLSVHPSFHGYTGDMSNALEAEAVVTAVEAEMGPIDVLVNGAGAARQTSVEDLDPGVWRDAMNSKYFSYINVMDPTIKLMAERGQGVIVNIIGNGGKTASVNHLPGGAANAALMLATVGLATAYAASGVRVIGINPGLTETGRVSQGMLVNAKQRGITEAEALAQAVKKIPIGRFAQPHEIAQMVVFLSSSQASYVTGVNIGMDGAQTATVV